MSIELFITQSLTLTVLSIYLITREPFSAPGSRNSHSDSIEKVYCC